MSAKRRRYLLLLAISVFIRVAFFIYSPKGAFFDWIIKDDLLYDIIFFAITISLFVAGDAQKWLVGLAWIVLIDAIAHSLLEAIQGQYSPLTQQQYYLYSTIMWIPSLVFYICIFFVRKNAGRIYFRFMTALVLLQLIYSFLLFIFNQTELENEHSVRAFALIMNTLLNLLLALAVWRTPELRKPEYADFLI